MQLHTISVASPLNLTDGKSAAAGANVCLQWNTIEPSKLVKELEAYQVSVLSLQVDLSSAAQCEKLAAEASKWSPTGGIDILISNAGAGKRKDWIDVVPTA